jgi:serine/threonine protein kinase
VYLSTRQNHQVALKVCQKSKLRKIRYLTYQDPFSAKVQFYSGLDELNREISVLKYLSDCWSNPAAAPWFTVLHEVVDNQQDDCDEIALVLGYANFGQLATFHDSHRIFQPSPIFSSNFRHTVSLSSFSFEDWRNSHYEQQNCLTEKDLLAVDNAMCSDITRQLLLGLQFLHEHNVCHRDIKPENLLCHVLPSKLPKGNQTTDCWPWAIHIQYCDFGCSQYFDRDINPLALVLDTPGTPMYWAPEQIDPLRFGSVDIGLDLNGDVYHNNPLSHLNQDPLDFISIDTEWDAKKLQQRRQQSFSAYAVDVWALGVTLHCFLFGCLPFGLCESQIDQLREITECEKPALQFHPLFGKKFEESGEFDLEELLVGMLEREPSMRWTVRNAIDLVSPS